MKKNEKEKKKNLKIDLFSKEEDVISEEKLNKIKGGDDSCNTCHDPGGSDKFFSIGTEV